MLQEARDYLLYVQQNDATMQPQVDALLEHLKRLQHTQDTKSKQFFQKCFQ